MPFQHALPLLTLTSVAIATYVGTTLDNLFMLVVLRASGVTMRYVAGGFLLGSAAVLLVCAFGMSLSSVIPVHDVGLLGAVPLTLGTAGLFSAANGASHGAAFTAPSDLLGIATAQVASSFDTIAAFLPLLVDTLPAYRIEIAGTFLLMTVLWILLAAVLARLPGVTAVIRPVQRFARPLVLVLIGLYVLANTAYDVEPSTPGASIGDRGLTQAIGRRIIERDYHGGHADAYAERWATLPPGPGDRTAVHRNGGLH
jgi:cadmium resistance protein CadD (predicted permease)